jgi:putative peptidoglycan lipid II flippase
MSVARNTLVQASLTLVSRVLGVARDVLLAARIGAGPVGDAWATALMFPNLFRRVFAEGAFASAFVPSYSRVLEADGPEAAQALANEALKALFAITAVFTIAAQIAMPWLMLVIHGGQADDPESFNLAVLLTRITMPYLTFISITALLAGVLNSVQRFVLSAGAPTLLNICLIGSAFVSTEPVMTAQAAAVATFIAGILQALLLWWGARRQNVRLSLIGLPRITPNVKKVMALALPGTIAASGTQINIIVSQALASYEVGAKALLYYADRLYQLPLGLVGVAVGVAILPRLSRSARAGDETAARRTMDEGIGLAVALTLPATAALLIAPGLLIEGIFARGEFLTSDAQKSALALFHYAWGVPAFVLIKVLAPAFFAREDMKTPMRYALLSVAINTVLGASLFIWFRQNGDLGFPGLAIATSVAAWVNAGALATTLMARKWYVPGSVLISRFLRAAIATGVMTGALIAVLINAEMIRSMIGDSLILRALVFILVGMGVYGFAALVTGAVKLSDLRGSAKQAN